MQYVIADKQNNLTYLANMLPPSGREGYPLALKTNSVQIPPKKDATAKGSIFLLSGRNMQNP